MLLTNNFDRIQYDVALSSYRKFFKKNTGFYKKTVIIKVIIIVRWPYAYLAKVF